MPGAGRDQSAVRARGAVRQLLRVVKNKAEGEALPAAQLADTVAYGYPVVSPAASAGTLPYRDYHGVTLLRSHDHAAGLHSGALLYQHKFSAIEVDPRPTQLDNDLQGEISLAVEILVEAVVVTGLVAKEQGRRSGLSARMALPKKFLQ